MTFADFFDVIARLSVVLLALFSLAALEMILAARMIRLPEAPRRGVVRRRHAHLVRHRFDPKGCFAGYGGRARIIATLRPQSGGKGESTRRGQE
jgi:hypothetical protein